MWGVLSGSQPLDNSVVGLTDHTDLSGTPRLIGDPFDRVVGVVLFMLIEKAP
jgi:hypothetical protein